MEISSIGVATAFAAGVISFLSPCVLPLVPGYISYVAGRTISADGVPAHSGIKAASRTLGLSLCFVLGFSTVFVLLGASATALGGLLRTHLYEANLIGGVIVVIFGLFTTGLVPMPWLDRDVRFHSSPNSGGAWSAYLLGLAFAFGWTPCIGPVLGSILALSAANATVASGTALLAVYSLGLGLPFILAALFMRGFMTRLLSMRRTGRVLKIVAGGVMVVMGIAMITGHLSSFAIWLLQTFPALGRIG
ncbi:MULTISPECIES: cytochrome c biogenesis CcdA family protein [Hyphomicrobiales]|uniref:Cytochrome c biogenesis protein CcdA n=1 Tax=Aquamicrobium defluvii TaxID=69279 RepID=A0A4R6Y1K1_9HYPH|nr:MULTISPECIES: cytochrome c biogenesis protein CcdA [Hyphomicrobiales]NSY51550.1 cytochrome c biogenesis protein CcdA [Agrobacterium tumefaciens]NTA46018.1 cytochrome c biogenesis protein CcdA [Agrobacterium tumefaciens]NTA80612.1 cytochrome c biogenesis protein CcdA [Agrobacterium tumefaciens]TDR30264.1 cytochrome c biogenesis protein CcdA [Aquamicrobium defluvii]UXT85396.1 cytochrome c biogenesis protein CcdA [Agrobacterium tumefaciens]